LFRLAGSFAFFRRNPRNWISDCGGIRLRYSLRATVEAILGVEVLENSDFT
jgi:hypothetical protein